MLSSSIASSTMATSNGLRQKPHQQNQALNSLFTALDPKSLILSQFSISDQPQDLQLTTDGFFFERGPRYKAYADLRESRLRAKRMKLISEEEEQEEESILTEKKQVKFQSIITTTPPRRSKRSSILAQSVPDFSSALRKENRKPARPLPPVVEKSATPPAGLKTGRFYGVVGKSGGSKSANSGGEKRGGGNGGVMMRKSYANIEEMKGLASAARNAINGDNRNGRITRGAGKTVLGCRQF